MTLHGWEMPVMESWMGLLAVSGVVSTAVLSLVLLLSRRVRNNSPERMFFVWQIAMIGLLLIPVAYRILPTISMGDLTGWTAPPPSTPSDAPIDGAAIVEFSLQRQARNAEVPELQLPLNAIHHNPIHPAAPLAGSANPSALPAIDRHPSVVAQPRWVSRIGPGLVVSVWFGGSVVLQAYLLFGLLQLRKQLATKIPFQRQPFVDHIPIYLSKRTEVPFTCGVFRPSIILPQKAEQWSDDRIAVTLQHERAHIQRGDVATQLLVTLVRNLFWFQPLAWKGLSEMKRLRELACDDQVLRLGIPGHQYAEVLLESVCEASPLARRSPLLVTMAEKPIQQRIMRILDPKISRPVVTRSFRWTVVSLILVATLSVAMLRPYPAEGQSPARDENARKRQAAATAMGESETVDQDFPEFLSGRLLDSDGNPVANARIRGRFLGIVPRETTKPNDPGIVIPEIETDADGRFQIPTQGIEESVTHAVFSGVAQADQNADLPLRFEIHSPSFSVPELKFRPSREIHGQVISADGTTKLQNPRVVFWGEGPGEVTGIWGSTTLSCESDGSFRAWVPRYGRLEINAYADNLAPRTVKIYGDKEDIPPIELLPGTRVHGKVIRQNGQPAAGILLELQRQYASKLGPEGDIAWFSEPTRRVKTDAEGRYEFPPCLGKYRLRLAKAAFRPDPSEGLASDTEVPLIAPVILELDAHQGERTCDLTELPSLTIQGTVRWADGTLAPDSFIQLGLGDGQIETVASTQADAQGQYILQAPTGSQSVHLFVASRRVDGVIFEAQADTNKPDYQNVSSVTFVNLNESQSDIDWTLRPQPPRPARLPPRPQTEEDIAFRQLERKYYDKSLVDQPLDRSALHRDLLGFEETYRGTHSALVALRHVLADGETAEIRNMARERFRQHYLEHPFADAVVERLLNCENAILEANLEIVRAIQQQNPSPLVRAATTDAELRFLMSILLTREALDIRDWEYPFPAEKARMSEAERQNMQQSLAELKKFDPAVIRRRVLELINQLTGEYTDIDVTHYMRGGMMYMNGTLVSSEGILKLERTAGSIRESYGERGRNALFQLNDLAIGRPIPALEALDSNGQSIHWEKFRGKFTLLVLDSPFHIEFLERQQRLIDLLQEHSGELQVVSLLSCDNNPIVQDALAKRPTPWPVIFDGQDGPLERRWKRDSGLFDIVVINGKGNIVEHLSFREDLENAIEALLK